MKNLSYNQLITLDMECGGLTKRQAVLSRTMDRRWKKAHNNILRKGPNGARSTMERYVLSQLGDFFDDLMES